MTIFRSIDSRGIASSTLTRARLIVAMACAIGMPGMTAAAPTQGASAWTMTRTHVPHASDAAFKGYAADQEPISIVVADDAAAVKRAIALEDGPVLLVGHSYGGAVITEAGNDPKVAGLVYVAAFAPDAGQSAGDLNGSVPPTPGAKEFRPDANGYLRLTDKGVAEDFAQDLTAPEKKLLAATQGQTSGPNELGAKVSAAAWREKPTFYIVADQDRMISPDLEKKMAAQMHAKTIHIVSSHVPMLSHPTEVANFIVEAAGSP